MTKKCTKCGSSYYGEHHRCAHSPVRTFKTRKQMGLKEGELPYKFRTELDVKEDGETEVAQKRALLRLNSQRVYSQMGCAVQALNSMKESAKWLSRLLDNMDEEDKTDISPILAMVGTSLYGLEQLSAQKVKYAVKMEELLEKERRKARTVRMRIAKDEVAKRKKNNEFGILRAGSPTLEMLPVGLDNEVILEHFRLLPRNSEAVDRPTEEPKS